MGTLPRNASRKIGVGPCEIPTCASILIPKLNMKQNRSNVDTMIMTSKLEKV